MLLARIGFVVGVVGGGREGKYFSISTEYTLQGRDVTLVCTRFTLLLLVVGHVEAAAADRGWPSSGLTLHERLGCVTLAPQHPSMRVKLRARSLLFLTSLLL